MYILNLKTIGKKNTETQALMACPINYDFVMFTQKALKSAFQLKKRHRDVVIKTHVDGKLITDKKAV